MTSKVAEVVKMKTSEENFRTLVVMEFTKDAKQAAVEWMLSRIQSSKSHGGAELLVRSMTMQHNQEDSATMMFISASTERLLLAAEMMEIKKLYRDGYYREFSVKDVVNFKGSEDLDNFLTMAEKQMIIKHELESIRASEEDKHIPGYENIKLYPGKSIVKKYLSRKIVLNFFPLHDEEAIKRLGRDWYKGVVSFQPIYKVKNYFGEKIALYFAFLGVYTLALVPPAFIGIMYFITSWKSVYREAIFAVFNLIWATIFLEAWKRYCAEMTHKWGATDTVSSRFEEPRANYYGKMGKNVVTGKPEPVYPKYKRILRFYGITVPVISVCLLVAFQLMLIYFWCQDWANKKYAKSQDWTNFGLVQVPTAIYAIVIAIVNAIYRKLATKLNDWENHRLQSSYENHLIVKFILFEFVNCFISLFYVAFYLQDMVLLRSDLAALLITQQVLGQIQEVFVPFFFFSRRAKQIDAAMKKPAALMQLKLFNGEIPESDQKQASAESTMDQYDDTIYDYLEMFLQFGYVFLFSSAFPLAAVWALINNVTEIRSDSFKMCRVFRRPFAEPAANIGAWQVAFEVISILAVITNCAVIGMNPEVQKLLPSTMTPVNVVLIFVVVEHIVLALKAAVAYLIPDVPKWVEIEIAKVAYQSKQALQKERLESAAKGHHFLKEFVTTDPESLGHQI